MSAGAAAERRGLQSTTMLCQLSQLMHTRWHHTVGSPDSSCKACSVGSLLLTDSRVLGTLVWWLQEFGGQE